MATLDEQLVEEWLNREGFFTMRGVKVGLSEMDLLAVRARDRTLECWHVEVQVSFSPMGYIGGDNNAKRRTPKETADGVNAWIEKKFLQEKIASRRADLIPNANWKYVFVHAVARHPEELGLIQKKGIILKPYHEVIENLKLGLKNTSSSSASGIVDILRYMEKNPQK